VVWDGAEDLEFLLEVFAKIHNGGDVAATVAVVGGGPDSHDVFVFEVVLRGTSEIRHGISRGQWTYLVAFVDELMGSRDKLETVYMVELGVVSRCWGRVGKKKDAHL
jgi:hypothetical protein